MSNAANTAIAGSAVTSGPSPLVSVVIAAFNHGSYLAAAIESARAQSYRPVEIIVVDDGSTDDTAAIVAGCPDARYIRQQNQGPATARNTGLRESRGPYVTFLDADDRLLPEALSAGMSCFRVYPECGFVFGDYRIVNAGGSAMPPQRSVSIHEDYYWNLLQGNFVEMHATVLYSRAALESVSGFDPAIAACEDYDLLLRVARRYKVMHHGAVVAEYRRHSTNATSNHRFMLRWALQVLRRQGRDLTGQMHGPDLTGQSHGRDLTGHRLRRAVRVGMQFYRDHYGNLMMDDWRKQMSPGGLASLLRWYPSGVARRAIHSLRRRLQGSRRSRVRFGSLRRVAPVSRQFGFDRGQPIDRRYIESFVGSFAADVRGQVLEVGDDAYSRLYGGNRITSQDVLHISNAHPGATIIADLSDAPQIPSDRFDCIILTQTLQLIFNTGAAIATLHRILKPGGILLVTVPGISKLCTDPAYPEADSWRFTATSVRKSFEKFFTGNNLQIKTYGNVLAACAFLYGLASHELSPHELDHHDPDYAVTIAVRAHKAVEAR